MTVLLWIGWKYMNRLTIRQEWQYILLYSLLTLTATLAIYHTTQYFFGEEGSVHVEVLLPVFVVGMTMEHKPHHNRIEEGISNGISCFFRFLVGISMPHFSGDSVVKFDDDGAT